MYHQSGKNVLCQLYSQFKYTKSIQIYQNLKDESKSKHTWLKKKTQYEMCEHTSSYGLQKASFAAFP